MRLSRYGHVMRRDETLVTRRVVNTIVAQRKKCGRPKKRWMDCVNEDIHMKAVSANMMAIESKSMLCRPCLVWDEDEYSYFYPDPQHPTTSYYVPVDLE